ncbi:MAG: hypothetical protein CM1200mP3_18340 [Chloroflexota bacterium]|nr:MAG: hypothetical protein CM1200mP3_18340 [Chloroflexota bacterium]
MWLSRVGSHWKFPFFFHWCFFSQRTMAPGLTITSAGSNVLCSSEILSRLGFPFPVIGETTRETPQIMAHVIMIRNGHIFHVCGNDIFEGISLKRESDSNNSACPSLPMAWDEWDVSWDEWDVITNLPVALAQNSITTFSLMELFFPGHTRGDVRQRVYLN